ncbi:hypothetical protein [Streptomyces sp. NPDC051211]|uniref:hypothetical protein n=1 Tax=Streptomyces sp. NPDC051211 TaxID=3154643 RepID=UPI00344CFD4C
MSHDSRVDIDRLPAMSRPELDRLFRTSALGEVPRGEGRGTVLLGRGGARVSRAAAALARVLAWQGKVFDSEREELRNRVSPFGVRAIRAKVYRGDSWVDGGECTVLDYSRTSFLAQRIRDEIREIGPGRYLGVVFWGRRKILNFSLQFGHHETGPEDAAHQSAVTIRATVPAERVGEVREALKAAGRNGTPGLFRFADMKGTHFARLVLVPAGSDEPGGPGGSSTSGGAGAGMPASVVYMSEVDAPLQAHLADLVGSARDGLDRVFGCCEGYPAGNAPDDLRIAWLRSHCIPSAAFYVNTVGRGLQQIRREARLREAIEEFLDRRGAALADESPARIRAAVQEYVTGRADLAWARSRPAPPGLPWRARQAAHFIGVPLAALVLLPFLVFALPVWAVLLWWHEHRDVPSRTRPDREHVRELAAYEDFVTQNPFTAVGWVKPGRFRRATLTAILFAVDYGARHLFKRGNLAGVKTIHFARWMFIDDKRRVVFASNYDGSLESYMDDFIDKVAWGLNAVFSNGLGYPRTRWLVRGGARDELAFKHYLRSHQLPTQVWYSAYDNLTTHHLETNARIRAGLFGTLSPAETEAWLALL